MDPVRDLSVGDMQVYKGDPLSLDLKDEELVKIIKSDIGMWDSKFKALERIAKTNEDYWAGDQIDRSKLAVGEAEIFVNRIMVAIETMASMITSVTPAPWVIVTPRDKRGRKLQGKVERHLRDLWEYTNNSQQKFERLLRNFFMSRVGIIKYFFNYQTNELDAKIVRLENIRFDLDVAEIQDSKFVAEYVWDSIESLMIKFPESKEWLESLQEDKRSKIQYIEYWGESGDKKISYTFWMYRDKILGKEENSYWNKRGKNHFKVPKKPYIPLNSLNLGRSVVDDTSLVEQGISIQDGINKRKRQIDRNADFANGKEVTSASAMTKKAFQGMGIKDKKVYLDQEVEDVRKAFAVVTGRAFEGGVYEDMHDSKREIDNIFGTHATTRGERTGQETAKGRRMLRDADYGRLDLTTRSYEQVAEDLYNGWMQLMHVFYKDKRPILTTKAEAIPAENYKKISGYTETDEDLISKSDFKKYDIKIIVKKGTTRPKDPEADREMALMLRQTGIMNPITFYELMGFENPRQEARREFLWQSNPQMLFPELGGEAFIDAKAVMHIQDINKGLVSAEEEVFDGKPEEFEKHIATHSMYMSGIEVDEDLDDYYGLPVTLQEAHKGHLLIEKMRFEEMVKEEQLVQNMGGQEGPPVEGQEGVPVGGQEAPLT